MKAACIADSQNGKGYFKEYSKAERENNRKCLTRMPLFEGAVYKYVYSCWNDMCVLVSAYSSAYVSNLFGGINKSSNI